MMAQSSQAKAETVILALGDSLTAGYGLDQRDSFTSQLENHLKETGHAVKIINGGVSGDTTAGGLSRVDWLLADNPDVAIVSLGGNDGLRGLSAEQTAANISQIVEKLQAADIPILLSGMMAPPNLGRDYSNEFNAVFSTIATKENTLLFPFFLEDVAGVTNLNQADGIHPNPEGVAVIVKNITPFVEKLLTQAK